MDIQELLSSLPQNKPSAAGATGMAPGMAELNQAATMGQMQQNPLAQAQQDPLEVVRQRLTETPEQKFAALMGEYNKKPKKKRIVQELLMGLFGNNYEAPQDRLRKRAQEDFEQETKRISLAPAFQRNDVAAEGAQLKADIAEANRSQKSQFETMKNDLAKDRLNVQKTQGADRIRALFQGNNIRQQQVTNQAPLTQARTGLINTQNDNAQATGGLTGAFGMANQGLEMGPDEWRSLMNKLKDTRDNQKFKPEHRPMSNLFVQTPFTQYDPISGDLAEGKQVTPIDRMSNTPTTIMLPQGNLSTKDKDAFANFGRAAGINRDLVSTLSRAVQSGQAGDFMGILKGNDLSAAARAAGAFGGKTFQEAMFRSLQRSGLYEQLNAYTGKQVSDRELKFMSGAVTSQTNDQQSALKAAVAPALLLEVTQLRAAKALPLDRDVTKYMEAEAERFVKETLAKKNPQLRTMREILAPLGILRGTAKKEEAPAGGNFNGFSREQIDAEVARRRKMKAGK